jgi:hypothetical protein
VLAVGTIALLVGAVGGWTAANALFDPVQPPAATTTLAATTPSADLTTTSVGPASPSTEEGDVGAGGGVSQGGPHRTGIIGDGVAVEFYADPANPDASIVESPSVTGFSSSSFAWGIFWSIEGGRLRADDNDAEIDFEPGLVVVGVEYENDMLWLLSEDAEWLIAYEPDSLCLVFPIRPEDGAQGRDPDVTVPECLDPAGDGE